jgi:hypothetical protein
MDGQPHGGGGTNQQMPDRFSLWGWLCPILDFRFWILDWGMSNQAIVAEIEMIPV